MSINNGGTYNGAVTPQLLTAITASESRQQCSQYLNTLRKDDLMQVARLLDVYVAKPTVANIKESILRATVDAKLRSQFIRGY